MDKPNQLFVPAELPDFSKPLPPFKAPIGKVIVAIPKPPKMSGFLYLPETVQGRLRPDCGMVVSVGADGPIDIKAGDIVLVRPYDGIWIDDDDMDYQVRVYGQERNEDGEFVRAAVSESIICRWVKSSNDWRPVATNIFVEPEGDWVEADSPRDSGLYIPSANLGEPEFGTVLFSGSMAKATPGSRIHFKSEGPEDIIYFNRGNIVDRSVIAVHAGLVHSVSH